MGKLVDIVVNKEMNKGAIELEVRVDIGICETLEKEEERL